LALAAYWNAVEQRLFYPTEKLNLSDEESLVPLRNKANDAVKALEGNLGNLGNLENLLRE